MDDGSDAREEMLELVRRARQRLVWERSGGVDALPRATSRRALPRRGNYVALPAASPAAAALAAASAPTLPVEEPARHATPSAVASPAARRDPGGAEGLRVIREDLGDCRRCKLAPTR